MSMATLPTASVIACNTDATCLYVQRGSASRTPGINGVAVINADGRYRVEGERSVEHEPANTRLPDPNALQEKFYWCTVTPIDD